MSELTLQEVDRDGAIEEALDRVAGDSRAAFFRKAAVAGGGLIGGGALLGSLAPSAFAATSRGDVAILNFALTLEYLEAAFYTEAVGNGALTGETARFARVVAGHERTHRDFLKKALGSAAVKSPRFNFRGTTESQGKFQQTAIALEDTGVAAYKGQAPLIDSDTVLQAALKVHTVEARHASWIRDIAGVAPAPAAFDSALSKRQVLQRVAATHFIVAARRTPRFTG